MNNKYCRSNFKAVMAKRQEVFGVMGEDTDVPYIPEKKRIPVGRLQLKERTVQGDVTINVEVRDNEGAVRMAYGKQLAEADRIGTYCETSEINIFRGDLVYTFQTKNKCVSSALPMMKNVTGFVSFNGLPRMGAKTTNELQQFVKFIGLAKTSYNYRTLEK